MASQSPHPTAADNQAPNSSDNGSATADSATPSSLAPSNPRFEHTITESQQKKRKADKIPIVSMKRQKAISPGVLAIPTGGNSIKWNKQQPGRQGCLADFEVYFKSLSDVDKDPFKKEMCSIRNATRKAKAVAAQQDAA
ncbi:hypothetical protein EI94DRAFT_1705334 [Lactarius quietus]|nr:hypothetical protein EI94DRAFT_1705334 [Lactarius quietus]